MGITELMTTINTLINLYAERGVEIKIIQQEKKALNKEIDILQKQLQEKEFELNKITESKKEIRTILEEIQKEKL